MTTSVYAAEQRKAEQQRQEMPVNSPDDACSVHRTLDLKAGGPLRDALPGGRLILVLHIPELVIRLQETPVTFHPACTVSVTERSVGIEATQLR